MYNRHRLNYNQYIVEDESLFSAVQYRDIGNCLALCKGIRNPESDIFLTLESGIQAYGIEKPEPGIRNSAFGIHNPVETQFPL